MATGLGSSYGPYIKQPKIFGIETTPMADITDALMCIGSSGCSEPCSYEQRRWPKPKRHYVDAAIVNPILMLTYLGFILQCFCSIIYVFEYPLELPVRLPCWNTLTSILATVWIPRWLWSFLQPLFPVAYCATQNTWCISPPQMRLPLLSQWIRQQPYAGCWGLMTQLRGQLGLCKHFVISKPHMWWFYLFVLTRANLG